MNALNREEQINKLQSTEYDLIIIGGGITGAGIALDAASRGMRVALLEKEDFAFGTSSRSTKLIHGGLRYLKKREFDLVRESGRERTIVHRLAPHMVIPEKLMLPIIEGGKYGYFMTSIGLWVYDYLAKVRKKEKRKMLRKNEAFRQEPLLNKNNIKGAGLYYEYRTDDARLTLGLIKRAVQSFNAIALNYLKVDDFLYIDGLISGVKCTDKLTNKNLEVKAFQVVNATGPWTDELLKKQNHKAKSKLILSKGVHLVIPKTKFPINQSLYFDVPDGRMIFAIPKEEITYIGTTDTFYTNENIDEPKVSKEDAIYLISAVNNMFPSLDLKLEDVISSWAGLRPLIKEKESKSPSEISRKDEVFVSEKGLISIAGGKLTGYRKMAQRIMEIVRVKHRRKTRVKLPASKTRNLQIIGGEFESSRKVKKLIEQATLLISKYELNKKHAIYLVQHYGTETQDIIDLIEKEKSKDGELRLLKAELNFCVHNEAVQSLTDFFIRRTSRFYFQPETVKKYLEPILEEMKNLLVWNETKTKSEKEEMEGQIFESKNFV